MKRESLERGVGAFLLTGYVVFGLAVSALLQYSKLASAFAITGVAWSVVTSARVPRVLVFYAATYVLILMTWAWGSKTDWQPLGNVATVAAGAVLAAAALHKKWVSCSQLLTILCIPAALNALAFLKGINYTTVLYDLDAVGGMTRFSGYIGHPNAFVVRLTLPLVLLTLLGLSGIRFSSRMWGSAAVGLCLASAGFGIYASGSKKGLLIAGVCGLFSLLSAHSKATAIDRTKRAVVLGALAFLAAMLMASHAIELESVARFEQMLGGADESTNERSYMLALGWKLFLERPFFGYGLNEFAVLSGLGYYSHNNLVELLVSGGVFIAVCYYGFIIRLLRRLFVVTRSYAAVIFCILVVAVFDATGITFSDRACQIFVGVLMALVAESVRTNGGRRSRAGRWVGQQSGAGEKKLLERSSCE